MATQLSFAASKPAPAQGKVKVKPFNGRWSKLEHENFLYGLQKFGRDWRRISRFVSTRTAIQARSHGQKYFKKMEIEKKKKKIKLEGAKMKRALKKCKKSDTATANNGDRRARMTSSPTGVEKFPKSFVKDTVPKHRMSVDEILFGCDVKAKSEQRNFQGLFDNADHPNKDVQSGDFLFGGTISSENALPKSMASDWPTSLSNESLSIEDLLGNFCQFDSERKKIESQSLLVPPSIDILATPSRESSSHWTHYAGETPTARNSRAFTSRVNLIDSYETKPPIPSPFLQDEMCTYTPPSWNWEFLDSEKNDMDFISDPSQARRRSNLFGHVLNSSKLMKSPPFPPVDDSPKRCDEIELVPSKLATEIFAL